jgi:hypothetical protein
MRENRANDSNQYNPIHGKENFHQLTTFNIIIVIATAAIHP